MHQEHVRTITNWVIKRLYGSHDKVPDSIVFEPIQKRQRSQLWGDHVSGDLEALASALLEIDHSQQRTRTQEPNKNRHRPNVNPWALCSTAQPTVDIMDGTTGARQCVC